MSYTSIINLLTLHNMRNLRNCYFLIEEGYVYINDEKIDEPYVKGETISREIRLPIQVGEDQLFVLGDNRDVSKDSRTFCFIDCKQVEGKVMVRVFPFNRISSVK